MNSSYDIGKELLLEKYENGIQGVMNGLSNAAPI
jgi:hypothetical protein